MSRVDDLPWDEIRRKAGALVGEMRANGGLAPVDVARFWADQELARADPFGASIPQVAVGELVNGELFFDELGVPEDWTRREFDEPWRLEMYRRYNDEAERIVGRRLLSERASDPARRYPAVKELYEIFEGRNEWQSQSWWLHQAASTPDELRALLDRVERRLADLRAFLFPPNWDEEKARLTALGVAPPRYRGQRGPVTFAASIFGPENLIFTILDEPGLAARFRDLILRAILERARLLDAEHGQTPAQAPKGWGWADDNCCLLTPDMYEFFGYPILKGVFDVYAPGAGDGRYQHSDSDMGHLLPLLGRLQLTGTNFGPRVAVDDIREHLPRAVIHGELAPFTYSRNEHVNVVMEFLRDFELTKEKRGLRFTTAGSINNGTRLTTARLVMAAVQRYGRFRPL